LGDERLEIRTLKPECGLLRSTLPGFAIYGKSVLARQTPVLLLNSDKQRLPGR
jgi:hypothetical protein